jgi:hypothetical protein
MILCTYPPLKIEWTGCSKTLAYKIQTPGNYPEESIKQIYPNYPEESIATFRTRRKFEIKKITEYIFPSYAVFFLFCLHCCMPGNGQTKDRNK